MEKMEKIEILLHFPSQVENLSHCGHQKSQRREKTKRNPSYKVRSLRISLTISFAPLTWILTNPDSNFLRTQILKILIFFDVSDLEDLDF